MISRDPIDVTPINPKKNENKKNEESFGKELLNILLFPTKIFKSIWMIVVKILLSIFKYTIYTLTYMIVTLTLTYLVFYLIRGFGLEKTGNLMFFILQKLKLNISLYWQKINNCNKIFVDDFIWEEAKEKLPGCIKEIKLPAAEEELTKFVKKNGKQLMKEVFPILKNQLREFLKRKTKITLDDSGNYRDFKTDSPIDQKLINDLIKLSPLSTTSDEFDVDIEDF
jgi:hypothetical protein